MAFTKLYPAILLLVLGTAACAGPLQQVAPAAPPGASAARGIERKSQPADIPRRITPVENTETQSNALLVQARAVASRIVKTLSSQLPSRPAGMKNRQDASKKPVSAVDFKFRESVRTPQSAPDFVDNFDGSELDDRWMMSDGWANGQPFRNGWSKNMHDLSNGELTLKARKDGFQDPGSATGHGRWLPYTAGELRSRAFYGVGCYTVCMKPSRVSGFSSSMYLLTTEYDTPDDAGRERNEVHNEIDIEFVGKDTRKFQSNFFSRVKDPHANSGSGAEQMHSLPFDAADSFHAYGIKWTNGYIQWYVDGQIVRHVSAAEAHIPSPQYSTMRILANIWPVNDQAQEWAGPLDHDVYETQAKYTSMSFSSGESCHVRAWC